MKKNSKSQKKSKTVSHVSRPESRAKSESKSKIRPLADRVLIQELEDSGGEKKVAGGIYIPETAREDRGSKKGKVVAVGEGRFEDGKRIPVGVKEGDTVLFGWGDKVTIEDKEYYIIKESEIIAIL